jgi:hypothetical protein
MKPAENDSGAARPQEHGANPGYALGRLAAALASSHGAADAGTRARAAEKAKRWVQVLKGMLSGTLRIGSRTPVPQVPAWATLQVVQGGFATGELLAAGPRRPHESDLLLRLGRGEGSTPPRAVLNQHFLDDAGFAELRRMLETGRYRVEVPEEGALLAVAWLLAHGRGDAARAVLDEIAPFFPRLRFYPIPHDRPLGDDARVHLQPVGHTVRQLRAVRAPQRVLVQREALRVWAPLADRIVELFMETVEGPAPALQTDAGGKPLLDDGGRHRITGGWPCQHYPPGWQGRAVGLLEEYRRLRQEHRLSARPDRPRESFAQLRRYLEICVAEPDRLTGRDVGMIRLLLAGIATRRGLPGSERLLRVRSQQAAVAALPTRAELAAVVAERLAALPQDEGLQSEAAVVGPVTADEAARHGVPEGHPLAPRFGWKVRRSVSAPVEELVRQGVLTSGESLARVIPAITAQVRASGLPDPALRRLYGAVYQAFRRRRSLLLLNLQSQVRPGDLPWVRAMEAQRQGGAGQAQLARQTLERVVALAVASFPQQILPNKLMREIRALAAAAELPLPLVDELAADIFMGAFAAPFLRAAQAAGQLLAGTLYERYYAIDYAALRALDDVEPAPYGGTPVSPGFFALCSERAGPADAAGSWVARNGAVIEQAQILTTHNLAVLFQALDLRPSLRPGPGELARRCFRWICRQLRAPATDWRARLHAVKNAAYAWRQMIFFLSLEPEDSIREFLAWAGDSLGRETPAFQARFRPALLGLARAVDGLPPENGDARRLLGWTSSGTHWLLEN